ncbi:MAG: hypothetical protein NCW75_02850 [Phycisphaera sp.]|nr:MAG: hypothetical protein NCW75_02850 [Phycisphaera sp.]
MADKDNGIHMMCPNLTCRKVLAVPTSARGKTVRCKACATAIRVPQAKTQEDGPNPRKSA